MNKIIMWAGACLLFWSNAFSLQAPYLIGAEARSSSSIGLTWRNNSAAYDSVVVLRKGGTQGSFAKVSTVTGTAASFVDTNLAPSQLYRYALYARSAAEVSDTSNTDSATTLGADTAFYGKFSASWAVANKVANLLFTDSLCAGKRIKIFRLTDNILPVMIADTTMPENCRIALSDASPKNRWSIYTVEERFDNYVYSVSDTLFALDTTTFFRQDSAIITGRILSEYPVYADSMTSWAAKFGDTIFIKENNTADSIYTVINAEDKNNPVFEKYRSFKKPCAAHGVGAMFNRSLYYSNSVYRITDSGPVVVDSCLLTDMASEFSGFLNDTLAVVSTRFQSKSFVVSVKKTDSPDTVAPLPFPLHPNCITGQCMSYGPYRNFFWLSTTQYLHSEADCLYLMQFISSAKILSAQIYGFTLNAPPRLYNGYASHDTLFTKSLFSFLDTTKHLAFLIQSNRLIICEYSVGPYGTTVSSLHFSHAASSGSPGIRLLNEGNRIKVQNLKSDAESITIYDCGGRVLLRKKIGYEKNLCLSLKEFPRGVCVIAVKSTRWGNEVATFFKK